jgi:hypothetical protein
MGKVYFIFVLLIILAGCGNKDGILSQKEMTDLLVDIRISEVRLQQYNARNHKPDSIKKQSVLLYREVFEKHNTTYEAYQKSVQWYMKRPKVFKKISENADEKLVEMRDNCE